MDSATGVSLNKNLFATPPRTLPSDSNSTSNDLRTLPRDSQQPRSAICELRTDFEVLLLTCSRAPLTARGGGTEND